LLIIYRSQWPPDVTGDDLSNADHASAAMLHAWDISEKLNGLKVNGRPVTQLGEQFRDHGFNGRAWVPAGDLVVGDQVATLDWPGIENSEQQTARATIVDAAPQITALWQCRTAAGRLLSRRANVQSVSGYRTLRLGAGA